MNNAMMKSSTITGSIHRPPTDAYEFAGESASVGAVILSVGQEVRKRMADGDVHRLGRGSMIRFPGTTTRNISTNDAMWELFQKHPVK